MDSVFILWGLYFTSTNENNEQEIIGVFSTKEEAEKVVKIWKELDKGCYSEGFNIEEYKLNDPELPLMYQYNKIPDVELLNVNEKGE